MRFASKIGVFAVTFMTIAIGIVAGKRNVRGGKKKGIIDDGLVSPSVKDNIHQEHGCDEFQDTEAYGLCIAFCFVKDCPMESTKTSKSCSKIKDNYARKTCLSSFPCEDETDDDDDVFVDDDPLVCPCWDKSYLLTVTFDNQDKTGTNSMFAKQLSCTDDSIGGPETKYLIAGDDSYGFAASNDAEHVSDDWGSQWCAIMTFDTTLSVNFMNVTEDEADICLRQIEERCDEIGTPIQDV